MDQNQELYTASYLQKLIGIPQQLCRERCVAYFGKYSIEEARKVYLDYQEEKRQHVALKRRLVSEHKCIKELVTGKFCCQPRAYAGWPYCLEHLPRSVRERFAADERRRQMRLAKQDQKSQ